MKYENGEIRINVYDLIGELAETNRAEVIDALACQQDAIDEVMNQVLDGYTSLGSYGPKGAGGNPDAAHGIDGARMRIAKASGDVAAEEIARLAEALKRAEAAQNLGWNAYHELLESNRRYA